MVQGGGSLTALSPLLDRQTNQTIETATGERDERSGAERREAVTV